jgi:hypothetical protein
LNGCCWRILRITVKEMNDEEELIQHKKWLLQNERFSPFRVDTLDCLCRLGLPKADTNRCVVFWRSYMITFGEFDGLDDCKKVASRFKTTQNRLNTLRAHL